MSENEAMTITEFLEARIAEDDEAAWLMVPILPGERADAFSPARLLAECAAKRAIIAEWEDPATFETWGSEVDAGYLIAADKAVRALAAVYADHPDYRQEWAL